jgi:hypothetical protein
MKLHNRVNFGFSNVFQIQNKKHLIRDHATNDVKDSKQGILKRKYHCTIDLLFDWFELVCLTNKNKKFQFSNS